MKFTVAAVLFVSSAAYAQDFQWPVSGPATQCFGDTFSGIQAGYYYDQNNVRQYFAGYYSTGVKMHRAVDIGAGSGAPIKPARAGTAWKRGSVDHFYGYHVVVDHGDGYYSLYGHMSQFGNFNDGARVELDTVIGYVGSTGKVTGPHLHFEIRHSSDSANYAPEAHYVPCNSITQGQEIPFDYPGIGPLRGQVPSYPNGLSPADRATVSNPQVTLSWNPIGGVDSHHVYIEYWTGVQYAYYYSYLTGSSANYATFWPAVKNTWYRWWVRAHNASGWGDWSGSAEFYFQSAAPAVPTGLSPQYPNNYVRNGGSVSLTWNAVPGATSHHVRVEFWNGSAYRYYYDWYTYSGSGSFTFWPVVQYSWYRWRVQSQTASGWSEWSTEGTSSGYAEFWFGQ